MKRLKDIREGTLVQLSNSIIEYYIRGKASNGRVKLVCFTTKHERYSHLDCSLTNDTKVIIYKP